MSRSWEERWEDIRRKALQPPPDELGNIEASDWFEAQKDDAHRWIGKYYCGTRQRPDAGDGLAATLARIEALLELVGEVERHGAEWFAARREHRKAENLAKDAALKEAAADRNRRQAEMEIVREQARKASWEESLLKREQDAAEKRRAARIERLKEGAGPLTIAPKPNPEEEVLRKVFGGVQPRFPARAAKKVVEFEHAYCGISGKRQLSKRDAETTANTINRGQNRGRERGDTHAYQCPDCDAWHVGHIQSPDSKTP